MPSAADTRVMTKRDQETLAAQRIACTYLIKGCENALFDLGLTASLAADTREAKLDERAVVILQTVLSLWRATEDTLSLLEVRQQWPPMRTLEDWLTVDAALPRRPARSGARTTGSS